VKRLGKELFACLVRPDATTSLSQKPSASAKMAFGSAILSAINRNVLSPCHSRLELAILKSMSRVATTENTAVEIRVSLLRFALVKQTTRDPLGSVPLPVWCNATRPVSKRPVALVIVPSTATPALVTMDVAMLAVAQMLTLASATLLVAMKAAERRALFQVRSSLVLVWHLVRHCSSY
jgi:hypothetical protein